MVGLQSKRLEEVLHLKGTGNPSSRVAGIPIFWHQNAPGKTCVDRGQAQASLYQIFSDTKSKVWSQHYRGKTIPVFTPMVCRQGKGEQQTKRRRRRKGGKLRGQKER